MDDEIRGILSEARNVAVVGLSDNPKRPSYEVGSYLLEHGYTIFPVNPTVDTVLGLKSYASVTAIPEHVDVVDVFRRPDQVMPVVEDAIAAGAGAIWMQEGVINEEAAARARQAGLKVVMNHCMKKEHKKIISF